MWNEIASQFRMFSYLENICFLNFDFNVVVRLAPRLGSTRRGRKRGNVGGILNFADASDADNFLDFVIYSCFYEYIFENSIRSFF